MSSSPPRSDNTDHAAHKERLLETITGADREGLAAAVADVHPAVLADVLEAIPPHQRLDVWSAADHHTRGETLTELHDEVLRSLAAAVDPHELARAMAPLQPDELADLEPHVPGAVLDAAVARMARDKRLGLERVRRYPEDVAGGLMDVDAVTVGPTATLADAVADLRARHARGERAPEHLDSLFVVDADDHLLGVVTLADMVSRSAGASVRDVMTPGRGLLVDTPVSQVAALFRDQDLLSAPVVNDEGVLLGRITVDDVIDVITEEAERSILAPAGLDEDKDLFAPLRATLGQRGPWLLINLASAFLAAWVIGRFESTIEQLVALAVLMPVVASMGGVAGQQSLALVIRGLALNHVSRANRWQLLRHEMANGAAIGVLFAVLRTCSPVSPWARCTR
ncbi:MAG: CBS domain-containing protein [Gammaproteobacteria bacterium]|jgi:magnesium transporter|nr:CBS domain-containing protein [Gammaproteobacteria bacterium]